MGGDTLAIPCRLAAKQLILRRLLYEVRLCFLGGPELRVRELENARERLRYRRWNSGSIDRACARS